MTMPGYLALQIMNRKKTKEEVYAKFPQYREEIERILKEKGYTE